MHYFISVIFALSLCLSSLSAASSMNKLFSDGMVLQRNAPIKIWGTDTPLQKITVTINNKEATTSCSRAGTWSLFLPSMKAGGPYVLTVTGSSTQKISDVLIGEVWLCSGQSNMSFPLAWLKGNATNPQNEKLPQLRLFKVEKSSGGEKANDINGSWTNADGNISKWSATAFHFGSQLHKHLKVPVGLINSSVGGTPVESWCDHAVLDSLPELKGHVGWLDAQVKKYPKEKEKLDIMLANWKKNGSTGKKPKLNLYAPNSPWRPAGLFNHMIAPIIGYTIKGAIWYQGESNAGRASVYAAAFKGMISDWRKQWAIGDFPFLTVQLANFKKRSPNPYDSTWAALREAQNESLSLANTGIAVIIDVGDANDIHPTDKKTVGYRLALNARKIAYGEDLIHSGPIYTGAKIEGKDIRISFKHLGDGLKIKGKKLTAFEIAGTDKKFVWAEAKINGTDVLVSASSITDPKYVRYGWAENPDCNLYNSADLPASPFRSDH